jgi:hypothetical protein
VQKLGRVVRASVAVVSTTAAILLKPFDVCARIDAFFVLSVFSYIATGAVEQQSIDIVRATIDIVRAIMRLVCPPWYPARASIDIVKRAAPLVRCTARCVSRRVSFPKDTSERVSAPTSTSGRGPIVALRTGPSGDVHTRKHGARRRAELGRKEDLCWRCCVGG